MSMRTKRGHFSFSSENGTYHSCVCRHTINAAAYPLIIFAEDHSASTGSVTSYKEQDVIIEEIGASFKLPAEMKWATRSKGEKKYIIASYNLDEESFSAYLKDNEYYFMPIDPNSSFRFNLIRTLAKADVKNSVLLSDQELTDELNSQEYADLLLLSTCVDKWVWRYEKNAILCLITKFEDIEQYILSATTAINGYFYTFSMRDTDAEYLRNTAEYIFSTFSVAQSNEQVLMNISLIGKQVKLPEDWTITDQSIEYVEGIGMSDNVLIQAYTPDGTRRVTMITIMDSTSLLLENATKAEREAFDRIFGKEMISTIYQSQGLIKTSALECDDINFTVFRIDENQTIAVMIGCVLGYIVQSEWSVPSGNALTDEWVPSLQEFLCDIVQIIKE